MKNRNWFWGIFFILAAVFVIASQTGAFGGFGVMTILATVLLITLMLQSIFKRSFFGIFISLALLYIIYRQPLHLVAISPWLLIFAAILASIGFSFFFRTHPQKKFPCHGEWEHFTETVENMDDNNPYAKVSFGASSKYLHGNCLQSGQFFVSFGALEIYFDQAQLSPEGAEIFLDCSFGAVKLYVPKHWQVIDHLHTSLGGIDHDIRLAHPDENAPRLTLKGNVQLGGVEVHYI